MISKGNDVKFTCFVLLTVSEEAKTLLDFQNNQGIGRGYQPQPLTLGNSPYLDVNYSGYYENLIQ